MLTTLHLVVKTVRDMSEGIRGMKRNAERIFKLGTFNVRGLTKEVKQFQQLQTNLSKQRRKETYSSTLVGNKLTIMKSEPVDHMINRMHRLRKK